MSTPFEPFAPENHRDPYRHYHAVRAVDPVPRVPAVEGWAVLRHEDVTRVLQDPRLSRRMELSKLARARGVAASPTTAPADMTSAAFRPILDLDPPDHTRVRSVVGRAFTPPSIESYRPFVESTVDALLDRIAGVERVDLVESLCHPLPARVIAEILGIPEQDRTRVVAWSDAMIATIDPLPSAQAQALATRGAGEMARYFQTLFAEGRRAPPGRVTATMFEHLYDRIAPGEMIGTAVFLAVAGHQTTSSQIANVIWTLTRHPEVWHRLREEPERVEGAVEELIRYDSSVQMAGRVALEDLRLGNRTVRRGDMVLAVIGAANRDPDKFPDPDRLDISREVVPHVAFGYGRHFCLGAALARLETRVAIRGLLRRYEEIRVDVDEPPRRPFVVLRGPASLPARCIAGPH